MPAPQHSHAADAWLSILDDVERMLDDCGRFWHSVLKHELYPTLKMQ